MTEQKDSYWISSGTYTFLHKIIELAFGFGTFWMLIRILDKSDFGVWVLLQTIAALIEMARLGFIQNAQIKFSAGTDDSEFRKINTSAFALNIFITAATVIILASIARPLSILWNAPQLEWMLYVYCIVSILYTPFMQSMILMQIKYNFKGIFWSHFVRLGLFFIPVLYFFISGIGVELMTLLYIMVGVSFISAVTGILFSKRYWLLERKLDFTWIKKIFHFGKYVFGTNLNAMLYGSIDQMMLSSMIGTASVATFNAASRILNFVEAPLTSISTIVFPKTAERFKTEGVASARYLYERSVGLMLAIILPGLIFCLLFPELIMTILAGEEYLDSVPVLQIIIFISILKPFNRQSGTFLDAIGEPRLNFLIVFFSVLINIVTNYILISNYGIIGAAYGTLIATVISVIIATYFLKKKIDIKTYHTFIYAIRFYKEGYVAGMNILKNKFKS